MSLSESICLLRVGRVPGYPAYRVLSSGSVWYRRGGVWRRKRCFVDRDGYLKTRLSSGGRRRDFYVHSLVLLIFVGPRPKGLECRHLDGNKANNRVENLCWGTSKENTADQIIHGSSRLHGSRQVQAKLTEEAVLEIRRRAAAGPRGIQTVLSREFGVSDTIISHVVNGKAWCHVE